MKRFEEPIKGLRVFSDPTARFVAKVAPPFGDDLLTELRKDRRVSDWIEHKPNEWGLTGLKLRNGILGVEEEDLVAWAKLLFEMLQETDIGSCGDALRSITEADRNGERFLKFMRRVPNRTTVKSWAVPLIVRTLGAGLNQQDPWYVPESERLIPEGLLGAVGTATSERLLDLHTRQPRDLTGTDLCWYERTWLTTIMSSEPRSRYLLLHVYFTDAFPPNWYVDEFAVERARGRMQADKELRNKLEELSRMTPREFDAWLNRPAHSESERELKRSVLERLSALRRGSAR
jgi:hypothetical protein